jgi:hypothetical protein
MPLVTPFPPGGRGPPPLASTMVWMSHDTTGKRMANPSIAHPK